MTQKNKRPLEQKQYRTFKFECLQIDLKIKTNAKDRLVTDIISKQNLLDKCKFLLVHL